MVDPSVFNDKYTGKVAPNSVMAKVITKEYVGKCKHILAEFERIREDQKRARIIKGRTIAIPEYVKEDWKKDHEKAIKTCEQMEKFTKGEGPPPDNAGFIKNAERFVSYWNKNTAMKEEAIFQTLKNSVQEEPHNGNNENSEFGDNVRSVANSIGSSPGYPGNRPGSPRRYRRSRRAARRSRRAARRSRRSRNTRRG
jgi:hypothetical protein